MARALNVRTIDAIKPDKNKRQEIPDNIVRGLYLVVQPSGAKAGRCATAIRASRPS